MANIIKKNPSKRKLTQEEGNEQFQKTIALADLFLSADRAKKQKLIDIGTFIDPESEKKKMEQIEYKTAHTWLNFLSKMSGELVRRSMVSDKSGKLGKNWQQANQEYFIDRIQKLNSSNNGDKAQPFGTTYE